MAGALLPGVTAAIVASTLAVFAVPATAQPQADRIPFDIPAQSLVGALRAFADQGKQQLLFDEDRLARFRAPALHGSYTPREALDALLAGSGVIATQPRAGTFALRESATAPAGEPDSALQPVVVTARADRDGRTEGSASYTQTGPSGAATGLDLTLRETPQSVTVMTRQRMDDFRLETLTDVMEQTPGVSVIRQGSYSGFQARGASVNLQIEGNPQRAAGYSYFGGSQFSLDSMADIDRIEVLKGSNGLLVGKGSTGATVNMIRKRPTRDFQASVGAGAGSWSHYSANADVSGPLNEAGTLRGRVAATASGGHSFRDHERNKGQNLYGTLEVDLTPATLFSTGVTYRRREVRGLAMFENIQAYSADDPDHFLGWRPRSYNPGASWSGYEQESTHLFARLEHQFSNGWSSKIQLAHDSIEMPELLLASAGDDFDTATRYLDTSNRNASIIADLKGPLQLFGRSHDLLVGAGATDGASDFDSNNFGPSHHRWKQRYAYAAGRLNPADRLKLIIGARVSSYESQDKTEWDDSDVKETGVVTPYAGLVVDVSRDVSVYASYASIFDPQGSQDEQGRTLAPREGLTYEIGAKGEFLDRRLNASISHFWIRTDNEPEATGARTPTGGFAYRAVMGASRRGYELELSGELARGWQVQGGFAMNSSNLTSAGSNPQRQFKLGTTYRFDDGAVQGLTVGLSARWQSTTTATASRFGNNKVQQASYWLVDVMGRYQLNRQLSVSANINNLFDTAYFAYVVAGYQGLGYTWGSPRSAFLSMRYEF